MWTGLQGQAVFSLLAHCVTDTLSSSHLSLDHMLARGLYWQLRS